MLQEIFKGMDNAAEMINENFKNGSIVEDNLNEDNPVNGYYLKYGNGWMVCFGTFTHDFSGSAGSIKEVRLAQHFLNTNYFGAISAGVNNWPAVQAAAGAGVGAISTDLMRVGRTNDTGVGLTTYPYNYVAFGRWK